MIKRFRRYVFELVFLLLLAPAACGGGRAINRESPVLPAASTLDAIRIDPVAQLPILRGRGESDEGVVSLRPSVASDAVLTVVHHWFEAFHARSVAAIEGDLEETLVDFSTDSEPVRSKARVLSDLHTRMHALAYDQLEVAQVYRPRDVEIYVYDDLGAGSKLQRPQSMRQDDVLVRVPVLTTRLGSERMFADELRFLVRRSGHRFRIRGYRELPR